MPGILEQFTVEAAALKAKVTALVASGVPLKERWATMLDLVTDCVLLAERFSVSGEEKRQLVGGVLGELYDVLAAIDIPYVPEFVEAPLEAKLKPVLIEYLLTYVDKLVERLNRADAWGQLQPTV